MLKRGFIYILTIVLLTIITTACGGDGGGASEQSLATLSMDIVDHRAENAKITTQGSAGTYVAEIIDDATTTTWCSLSITTELATLSGEVGEPIYLYLQENNTNQSRTAKIKITYSDGYSTELSLTQNQYIYDRQWAEQPAFNSDTKYIHKTYHTTDKSGNRIRSYSICYDTQKYVSRWVAYPLHKSYTVGAYNRTDDWQYDPNVDLPEIPVWLQHSVADSYEYGLVRGHQLTSSHRYIDGHLDNEINRQTFYPTNIMPQDWDFNGGIWVDLEMDMRANAWAMPRDTLYVVTGAHFGDNRTTYQSGKQVGVPSHCWKVLLRTKSGSTGKQVADCTADELIAIGFWFENNDSQTSSLNTYTKTVAEIEALTGFELFQNLDPAVESSVKSQNNLSHWSSIN